MRGWREEETERESEKKKEEDEIRKYIYGESAEFSLWDENHEINL